MSANLTKVFVVDVEATCWETPEEQGTQPNEVIEIGICELNVKTGKIDNGSSYVIQPRFTKVSAFCTQLTGWTQEAVDNGGLIIPTLQQIEKDYGLTKNHLWFSCGEYDRIKLGCQGGGSLGVLYGVPRSENPFDRMRHVNIKTLFALKHKLPRELGMAKMLNKLGEKLEGRHHNGCDDALNIAKIVKHILF
jgi:inhibitor of KinA sporulation pathway (predicted exonuclease)